jgi:hypothetical protein
MTHATPLETFFFPCTIDILHFDHNCHGVACNPNTAITMSNEANNSNDKSTAKVSRIDYSKWNHLEDSDDDDNDASEDEDEGQDSAYGLGTETIMPGGVRVTRLEQPTRVTLLPHSAEETDKNNQGSVDATKSGSRGVSSAGKSFANQTSVPQLGPTTPAASCSPAVPASTNTASLSTALSGIAPDTAVTPVAEATTTITSKQSATDQFPPTHWTERGCKCELQGRTLYWTQDRTTVNIRMSLLPDMESHRGWKCIVHGSVDFANRLSATLTDDSRPCLEVTHNLNTIIKGTLAYPVYTTPENEDSMDGSNVDWSIESVSASAAGGLACTRFVTITLYKAVPMAGLTLWWSRLSMETPTIEVQTGSTSSTSSTSSARAFEEAWRTAHEGFRQSLQGSKKESKDEAQGEEQDDESGV